MLVTKNMAEFSTLLVDEIYGELPSRIFATLLNKGRSTLVQLVQYTAMNPKHLRHGIAVLLQHNLLFFYTDSDTHSTFYEANAEHAYNLIRAGKILEMVETSFGAPAKDVMQSLLLLGSTRISDLSAAYQIKINKAIKAQFEREAAIGPENGANGANGTNGDEQKPQKGLDLPVESIVELNSILCQLVNAELVEVVHDKIHQNPADIETDVNKEVTDKYFPGGAKGAKGKSDFQDKAAAGLRSVREASMVLKRRLVFDGFEESQPAKRRKLFNGISAANGALEDHDDDVKIEDPTLDATQVIRINYEKCIVDLRNRRLVQFAAEMIGDTTAYVYGVFLRQATKYVPRCHMNPQMDFGFQDGMPRGPRSVTTAEILANVKPSIDLSVGIGKTPKHTINTKAAEKIRKFRAAEAGNDEAEVDGPASSDEDDSDESDDDDMDDELDVKEAIPAPQANGGRESKVKFADSSGKEPRIDRTAQLRQHLLLLTESKQGFIRHCAPQEWAVDIDGVIHQLRQTELDTMIERSCGRYGLRLAHILRSRGKLDEKTLSNIAFMTKPEVQRKLLEMEVAGFAHTQEVPKDAKHDVKKSVFLWFCDMDQSLTLLLDKTYKAMLRCMQTLDVLREKDKDVLQLTNRTDVRGREKDVMRKEYFDRYSRFLTMEKKLMGQVQRLDDLVGVFREY